MTAAPIRHGALALLGAAQLVAARAAFDAAQTDPAARRAAAETMLERGSPFDQGRARTWLRLTALPPRG